MIYSYKCKFPYSCSLHTFLKKRLLSMLNLKANPIYMSYMTYALLNRVKLQSPAVGNSPALSRLLPGLYLPNLRDCLLWNIFSLFYVLLVSSENFSRKPLWVKKIRLEMRDICPRHVALFPLVDSFLRSSRKPRVVLFRLKKIRHISRRYRIQYN
jgi:hypothetical protein